ncbi:MAG: aspartate carbamoyltransferase regulatory subunit [Promethearchaeota archaeon]
MAEKQLRVRKINKGTVIDHIPQGKALTVLNLLGISESNGECITIAMNIPSSKIGKKDIIKIENIFLSDDDFNKIALIAPKATINKIIDTKIAKKEYVTIPEQFSGIIRCINPNCISNKENEPIKSKFLVINKKPLLLECSYCGRKMTQDECLACLIFR